MAKFIVATEEEVIGEGNTETEAISNAENYDDISGPVALYQRVARLEVGLRLTRLKDS